MLSPSALKRIVTNMIDLTGVTHHPVIEEICDVICAKTQNTDRGFFRAEVAYFLAKMASSMRATVVTRDRGEVPINVYAVALASSGYGKGHSVSIMEGEFIKGFKTRFMQDTMPAIAEAHLWDIANARAARNSSDAQDEFDKVSKEWRSAGAFAFTFDSGTSPAVKQLRHKLILSNIGSINMQIDEIGSNLIANVDVLTLFLELYDQGLVKQKLTKNTAENQRGEEVDGKTPTNALLFGTPVKLLDGGQTEDQFYSFLETGYARRSLFALGKQTMLASNTQTPSEIYLRMTNPSNNQTIAKWADHFHNLAEAAMYGWKVTMPDTEAIKLLEYKINCENAANALPDHEEIRKAELSHRYFKALKLAGALAFVDRAIEISMDHLLQAILLVEESGLAFQEILNREKNYVKLARYIASCGTEVTHADLHENLPFYKSGIGARNEMMTLATAWGYKQHISIKKTFVDGIEFFKGETLKRTNLDEMVVAYSDHYAYEYAGELVPFEQLFQLTQSPGFHWINHHVKNGHRAEENIVPGFNMIVIDVDGGVPLATCHELLKDYKFMTYTTKRHTDDENRFRLIIPMNYTLNLDGDEYKEFMNSFMAWLPFKTDESANQRAKKWETFPGQYHYNMEGELLDVLPFIPKTTKNEEFNQSLQKVASLDNLERWFATRMANGNRNNQMIKFALALVDSGMNLIEVQKAVLAFNDKLSNKLAEDEINSTIMVTVGKRLSAK